MTEQPIEIIIKKAMEGIWTYVITNPTTMPKTFSVQTSTAGTGIITGCVRDAASGAALEGTVIASTIGMTTRSSQGYYAMVHPAGSFSLQASDSTHMPCTLAVMLSAGASIDMPIVMSMTGVQPPPDDACVLSGIFGNAQDRHLVGARVLRDNILSLTESGRRYTRLYYQYSPEVVQMVKADPELKAMIRACVVDILPKMLVKASLTDNDAQSIRACLATIRGRSSGSLAAEIDTLIARIEAGKTVKEMLR